MSGMDNEPSMEFLVLGKEASDEDIVFAEQLALGFLEGLPKETIRQMEYEDDVSETVILLMVTEEDGIEGSFAIITLGDMVEEDALFSIAFDPNNGLAHLHIQEGDEQIYTTIYRAIASHLESGQLNAKTKVVASHLQTLAKQLGGDNSSDLSDVSFGSNRGPQFHVADIVREIVGELSSDKYMVIQTAGLQVSNQSEVYVTQRKFHGYTTGEIDELNLAMLEVCLSNYETFDMTQKFIDPVSYYFIKGVDGIFSTDVNREDPRLTPEYTTGVTDDLVVIAEDKADSETEEFRTDAADAGDYSDELTELLSPLYSANANAETVRLIIESLIQAGARSMLEHMPSTEQIGLKFGFVEDEFYEEGHLSAVAVAKEAIRSLDTAMRLSTEPTDVELRPSSSFYYYGQKRAVRVEKFVHTKVTTENGHTGSRGEFYDINVACQNIMDTLAEQNDPVAQMYSSLYSQYRELLGDTLLVEIATEIIKQTHEPKIRSYYIQRLRQQSLGEIAVAH